MSHSTSFCHLFHLLYHLSFRIENVIPFEFPADLANHFYCDFEMDFKSDFYIKARTMVADIAARVLLVGTSRSCTPLLTYAVLPGWTIT